MHRPLVHKPPEIIFNVVVDEEDSILIVHQNWLETLRDMTGASR